MSDKIRSQLEEISNNKNNIFSEFLSNEDSFSKTIMLGNSPKVSILYDIENIHNNNKILVPSLSNILDESLSVMSISITNFKSDKQ